MAIDKNVNNKNNARRSRARKPAPKSTGHKSTGRKKHTKKNKKKGFKVFIKRLFFTIFFLVLSIMVVGAGYVFAVIKSAPPLDLQAVLNLSQPTSLFDKDGVFMDNLHSEIDRTVVSYDQIPQYLKDGFVSIEDQRFESHRGIDPIRIGGSLLTDITKLFRGQRGFHGGSTITQQLLKNSVLSDETSAVQRKIKEIWYALSLEKQLSKAEILNQYLNTIPLGGTTYGVEAAANYYFGKSVSELNLIQCAYISGVAQAPTYYSAYNTSTQTPLPYITRTKSVLRKMYELNKITQSEYDKAIADIDAGQLQFTSTKKTYTLEYEWYINPTVSQVKSDLKTKYKYSDEEVSKLLANGGLKITTNMDRELQDYTQKLLNQYSAENVGYEETYITGTKTPEFQASATIVDYKTGKVLAMIGGRGDHGANSSNRAYTTLRPVGSTTKPLTVYGPAINEKVLTAGSTIDDAPLDESTQRSLNGGSAWNLNNDDRTFAGNVTLRYGLKYSKNIVAVKVLNTLGLKTALSYGEKFGLVYNDVSKSGPAALALGQFDGSGDGGNTYITSSAFGVFGNGGVYTEPKLYSKVVDASGNVLLDSEANMSTKQIFSEQTAWIMYDLLKGSRSYTGPSAQWGSIPVAGKTGTASNSTDLWFTGLTPYLSGSVWLGYDTPRKMTANSNAAAALWGKIMAKAHENMSYTDIEMPSGITTATICMDSGKLASDLCYEDPRKDRVYDEYFIEGTEPTTYCDAHVSVSLNSSNNRLANSYTPSFLTRTSVYVKKSHPNSVTEDYPYLLPKFAEDDYQETSYPTTEPETEGNSDEGAENNNSEKPETSHNNSAAETKPAPPSSEKNNNNNNGSTSNTGTQKPNKNKH